MIRTRSTVLTGFLVVAAFAACGDKNSTEFSTGTGGATVAGSGGSAGVGAGGATVAGSGGSAGVGAGGTTGTGLDGSTGAGGSPSDTPPAVPSFVKDIMPFLDRGCVCHGSKAGDPPLLDNYADVRKAGAASDKAIQSGAMPKGAPLSAADKALFHNWVVAGMPNN